MRKIILRNFQSPGDIVMLTAAVRDLHKCHPNEFAIDVRTSSPALWENNPNITKIDDQDTSATAIECKYPLIHESNHLPYHFVHAFIQYLNTILKTSIRPTAFRGDIYISTTERKWISQVHELTGKDLPYWVVSAGGKLDYTIKWWDSARYQQVIDHFRNTLQFVQIGAANHSHPQLTGVIDLRGKTDLRQLVRLIYHSDGVLTPVSLPMHLAAAVPFKRRSQRLRPCVVVAGGREPPHWEAYPGHQFLHRVGTLACCENGGCWKSRTVPLGDGDLKDRPEDLCVDVVGKLPRCMDMIHAEDVIRAIETYLQYNEKLN